MLHMVRTSLVARASQNICEAPRQVKDAVSKELLKRKAQERKEKAKAAKAAKVRRKAKTEERKEKAKAAKAAKANKKNKEAPPEIPMKSKKHFEVLKGFI